VALQLPDSRESDAEPIKPIGTLSELFDAYGGLKSFSATFREKKHMSVLLRPLASEGQVNYDAATKSFSQHVDKPFPYTLVLLPEYVGKLEDGSWSAFEGEIHLMVRQVLDSFLKLLEGDREGMMKLYAAKFSTDAIDSTRWTVTLVPRNEPLSRVLSRVTISGRGREIIDMEVREASGDRRIMTFSNVKIDKAYSAKERLRFFPKPK